MNKKVVRILQSFNVATLPPGPDDPYVKMTKIIQSYESEIDVMAIFPGAKVIVCIEVKSCLNITKPDGTLNDGLDKAMKQLRRLRKFFTDCHGEILTNIITNEWSFIGAIAVPMIYTPLSIKQDLGENLLHCYTL